MPPNGLLIRFHRIVRPTLPCFSVAPMTAIERRVEDRVERMASSPRTAAAAGVDDGVDGAVIGIGLGWQA